MTDNTTDGSDFATDILMNLIVSLLAPMFLGVSGGDIGYARMAAIQTVAAYRAATHADLIDVAQIVAFGLAALGSISLSMADDLSLTMTLRLRGNANALHRSAERNRRAMNSRAAKVTRLSARADVEAATKLPAPEPAATKPAARMQASPPPAPMMTDEREHQAMWATAMANVAAELNASLPTLSPQEHAAATMRAAALTTIAEELRSGISAPRPRPGDLNHLMRPNPA